MTRRDARRRRGSRCARADTDALLYLAGEMTASEAEDYARHSRSCADCSAAVKARRELFALLEALPPRNVSPTVLSSLSDAAMAFAAGRTARTKSAERRRSAPVGWRFPRVSIAFGWALGVLLLFGSARMLGDFRAGNPPAVRYAAHLPRIAGVEQGTGESLSFDAPLADVFFPEADSSEASDRPVSTEIAALRESINTLSLVIASDDP